VEPSEVFGTEATESTEDELDGVPGVREEGEASQRKALVERFHLIDWDQFVVLAMNEVERLADDEKPRLNHREVFVEGCHC
jgi:hypothetical protein